MRLYVHLDSFPERALYCDTDCVFYIQKENETAIIQYVDSLGSMVNELKPSQNITDSVSAWAKNYANKILNSTTGQCKTVCDVREITLNYSVKYLVKFDVISNMILNPRGPHDTVTLHTDKKINRKRGGFEGSPINIITEPEDKIYRVCFTKCRRLSDNSSVPFGYINR
jgi:hypothetical protein